MLREFGFRIVFDVNQLGHLTYVIIQTATKNNKKRFNSMNLNKKKKTGLRTLLLLDTDTELLKSVPNPLVKMPDSDPVLQKFVDLDPQPCDKNNVKCYLQ